MTQPPDDTKPPTRPANADAVDEPEASDIIDQLSAYLDRGESPPHELLDLSPDNQIALHALLRFRALAASLLADDVAAETARDDGWVAEILANIRHEAHAGRSIPVAHPSPRAQLSVTEGAVRGLIRAACDRVPGVLVGRCLLDGDVTVPGAPITVDVQAIVFWGVAIPPVAERLRTAIFDALSRHTELSVVAVDVTVTDLQVPHHDEARS